MSRLSVLRELFDFLRIRKKFWLLPLVVMLLVMGLFVVLTGSSALAPFIYALF